MAEYKTGSRLIVQVSIRANRGDLRGSCRDHVQSRIRGLPLPRREAMIETAKAADRLQQIDPDLIADLGCRISPQLQIGVVLAATGAKVKVVAVAGTNHRAVFELAAR